MTPRAPIWWSEVSVCCGPFEMLFERRNEPNAGCVQAVDHSRLTQGNIVQAHYRIVDVSGCLILSDDRSWVMIANDKGLFWSFLL